MNNIDMSELRSAIADINNKLRSWRWSPGHHFGEIEEEAFEVLERVSDFYLNASPEERVHVRKMMHEHEALHFQLFGFLYRATQMVEASESIMWLRLGLAAASIEDIEEDPRETYGRLGQLFRAAARVGIDPIPYFAEVGALSSPEVRSIANESMQDLLRNFHDSPYYEKELKPKIETLSDE